MDPRLEAYLKICLEQYQRMERDGVWPWTDDSTDEDAVVESGNNPEKI